MNLQEFRSSVLEAYGANPSQRQELLAYNENRFDHHSLTFLPQFPLTPEPHVWAWEQYAAAAQAVGVFEALKQRLVQLQFPIREGISQTAAYQAATRKGLWVDAEDGTTGLSLQQPDQLQLKLHQSLAGPIPVLIAADREDFVALVQALTLRNEPKPVPDSMGACMIAGFNNWDRVYQYRQRWEAEHPTDCSEADWAKEFQRFIAQKSLYQDRFILLSSGPYSAVAAADLGLSAGEWQRLSLAIRLEHECTHYFTRRLFASMRNNLLDELIADYRGMVAATGCYRADWFLRFLGLDAFPATRPGGRLHNYRGQPPLCAGAFEVLKALVKSAAENLERFDRNHADELARPDEQALMLIALTHLTLEELASQESDFRIQMVFNDLRKNSLCRACVATQ